MFPLVWVSVGVFCGLVSYSAKLWGQSPDVLLPIVTTIVYGSYSGLAVDVGALYAEGSYGGGKRDSLDVRAKDAPGRDDPQ